MKKKLIFISLFIALVVASTSIVFAWWTKSSATKSITASTSGIIFTYQMDEKTTLNDKYSVSDVPFFAYDETDGVEESSYLLDMACVIEISVTNVSKVEITLESTLTTTSENDAYLTGFFSETKLDALPTSLSNSLSLNIDGRVEENNETTYSTSTFYLYLYGIQKNNDANNDFLSESYDLTLTLVGSKKTS